MSPRVRTRTRRRALLAGGAWLLAGALAGGGPLGPAAGDEERDPRVLIGSVDFTRAEVEAILELSPLPEVPPDPTNAWADDPAAARLGQALFYEQRLSANGEVSCATCHDPRQSWTDGRALGLGIAEQDRNTMSLWNVGHNRWYFWDGRRDSLWSQALAPLENPTEHDFTRLELLHFLAGEPAWRRAYEQVFGPLPDASDAQRFPPRARPVDVEQGGRSHPLDRAWRSMTLADRDAVNRVFANAGKAIAAFERLLVSRGAPFDQYVEGLREGSPIKQRAITDAAKRGLRLFIGEARCFLCHTGPNFTDKEFHNDRVPERGGEFERSPGRYGGIELVQRDPFNGMGRYSDDPGGEAEAKLGYLVRDGHALSEFKTPSLRNVALTAPYMRQGQFATLRDVLLHYSTFEGALPADKGGERILQRLDLEARELADLEEFLQTLTDTRLPAELLGPPATPDLPAGG